MNAYPPGSNSQKPGGSHSSDNTGGPRESTSQEGQHASFPRSPQGEYGAQGPDGNYGQTVNDGKFPARYDQADSNAVKKRRPGVWIAFGAVALLVLVGTMWAVFVRSGDDPETIYELSSHEEIEHAFFRYEGHWTTNSGHNYEPGGECIYSPSFEDDRENLYEDFIFDPDDIHGSVNDVLYRGYPNSGDLVSRGEDFSFEFDGVGTIEFFTLISSKDYGGQDFSHNSSSSVTAVHYFGESDRGLWFQLHCWDEEATLEELLELMGRTQVSVVPLRP